MAKPSKKEALAAWREAEEKYRKALVPYLDESAPGKIDKTVAVTITKARVKADRKMEAYLHSCLG
jgi:hypothetical protein